jgi:hypothetical protein
VGHHGPEQQGQGLDGGGRGDQDQKEGPIGHLFVGWL